MKRLIPLLIILLALSFACSTKKDNNSTNKDAQDTEVKKEVDPLEALSKEMKDYSKEGLEVDQTKLDAIKTKLTDMFPKAEGDFKGYTWDISISKSKDDNYLFISANFQRKKGEEDERVMWFHILYNPNLTKDERDNYGSDNFEGYKGSLNEDNHFWILVNNVEIRAIAESEDFKKDTKNKRCIKKL